MTASQNNESLPLNLVGENESPRSETIDETSIRRLVELFYTRIQQDQMLGPIFGSIVTDWDMHFEKMTRFWSSSVLKAGTYSGRPLEAHRFGGLTKAHFDRWVQLFSQTAHDVFSHADAEIFVNLGKKMAINIAMRIGTGKLDYSPSS